MALGDLLAKLAADPLTNNTILLVAILPLLDLITGVLRAIANKTFTLDALDVWVRTKVAGRVLPIILVLVAGEAVGDVTVGSFSFNVVTIAAMAAAVTFVAAEAKSIIDNLNANEPDSVPVE